jgi:hypothetical protein
MRTNRVLRLAVIAMLGPASLGSVGCGTMNHAERGATIGGMLGTATGLGIGAATGNPKTGALIGGLAGGGIGALAGSEKDAQERRDREVIHAEAVATAQAQAEAQRMGVSDVMQLTQGGHSDEVIINQIRNTGSTFQLSGGDLDMLKHNGVSSAVIAEMQNARPASPARVIVREPRPRTVIVHEPVYTPPVIVRPYCVHPQPRPVMLVGGHMHWH